MDESFRGLEHGIDERIPIEAMAKMVQFYAQLMQAWGTKDMVAGCRIGRRRRSQRSQPLGLQLSRARAALYSFPQLGVDASSTRDRLDTSCIKEPSHGTVWCLL